MKTKFIFYLLSLCSLLLVSTTNANSSTLVEGTTITLSGNDEPFERPVGIGKERRSVTLPVPISAFLSDNRSVEINFFSPVGVVEIVISHEGEVIYSSTENIDAAVLKSILLPQDLSGSFMLEIKGSNGACASGWFNLN